MIKKDKRIDAKGRSRTQIRVVEGYRSGPGLSTKQRTIKDFGCIEDQENPEEFIAMVEEYNATYKKQNIALRIEASGTAMMYNENNRRYNYGYKFLEAVYDMLEIDEFIEKKLKAENFRGGIHRLRYSNFLSYSG